MTGRYHIFPQAMRLRLRRTCLFFLCIIFLGFSAAPAAEFSLIVEPEGHQAIVQTQQAEVNGLFRSATRWRRIDLLKRLTLTDGITKGDEIVFNLFPDTVYQATVDRVSVDVQGTISVRGRLRNYPLGYALISTTGDLSLANIRVPELGVEYKIVYDSGSRAHYILDNDPSKMDMLEDSPAVIPPPPKPEERLEMKALQERILFDQVTNDSTATIDVMVVYTPEARLWANSNEGSINNTIAQAMEKAQLVADNSGTLVNIHLVHSEEVAYTESGDEDIDLDRLQGSSDGYLDSVHTLRNTYGADLVVLFTKMENTGGIAYILGSPSGNPAYAFSITRVQQASWTYTAIHEIGHNMGLGHHKDQNVEPGPGLYLYSAGWRWVSTDSGRYCSVMTYQSGSYFSDGLTHTRVPYFSNPSIAYIGEATGHATNGDNARTVREMKNIIAAYRQATPAETADLYASFTGSGIWKWDGTAWNQVTASIPQDMAVSGSVLYGDFGSGGIWKWDGSAWGQVTASDPQMMAFSGSILFGAFGLGGIWKWDGTAWSQVTASVPQDMAVSGAILYGDFGSGGIWKWDGSALTQVTASNPDMMVVSGSILYGAFGSGGIWKWDGAAWSQVTASVPQDMAVSGSILYGVFGSGGIWKWDGAAWSQVTASVPQNIAVSGSILYGDFGPGGIWKWDGAAWSQVTPSDPISMVTGS